MKKACVIGWPIEHSRSPMIHGYWLNHYGIDGQYTKEAVAPDKLESFLLSLTEFGLAGCNVTLPHKEHAYSIAKYRDGSAIAVKAANTLWLENGDLAAANTDTYGYMAYLTSKYPAWDRRDAPVSVLGAGGAARAIIFGFLEAGVAEVRLFNRSQHRADELAQEFGARVKVFEWSERSTASIQASVIVNTTSVGLNGDGDLNMEFTNFHSDTIVSDIVYAPLETAYMHQARIHGLRTLDGLGMLLHQAVPGFEKWFSIRPEVTDELYKTVADTL